jgi:protein-S-isoprenylcysteine O-methyltransferase Ste14
MRARAAAIGGTFLFFWAAPAVVAGLVPYLLTGWQTSPAFLGLPALRVAGAVMLATGTAVVVECFARFAVQGRGTPAPVAPTETLVATGLYRVVRNPMYVGVLAAIAGQALLFGSAALLLYAAVIWLAFDAFIAGYEEPTLARQYGDAYENYRRHVPRWIPRFRRARGTGLTTED